MHRTTVYTYSVFLTWDFTEFREVTCQKYTLGMMNWLIYISHFQILGWISWIIIRIRKRNVQLCLNDTTHILWAASFYIKKTSFQKNLKYLKHLLHIYRILHANEITKMSIYAFILYRKFEVVYLFT